VGHHPVFQQTLVAQQDFLFAFFLSFQKRLETSNQCNRFKFSVHQRRCKWNALGVNSFPKHEQWI